jgi:sRNA-binding carbon storage regulator CsrA
LIENWVIVVSPNSPARRRTQSAPKGAVVHRKEIYERVQREKIRRRQDNRVLLKRRQENSLRTL